MARLSKDNPDKLLAELLRRFRRDKSPIEIDFRASIPSITYQAERATHKVHPYPAKLLANIPFFFLQNSILSQKGSVVCDPFCGSGTVLVEGLISGRSVIGIDSNPFARLLSRVKTNVPRADLVEEKLEHLLKMAISIRPKRQPDVVNIKHWYYPKVAQQLTQLHDAIAQLRQSPTKEFFLVCLSSCARKVSLCDPRVSVPVRLNKDRFPEGSDHYIGIKRRLSLLRKINVFDVFRQVCTENLARVADFKQLRKGNKGSVLIAEGSHEKEMGASSARIRPNSVDLVVTSPPYAGAQKYIRASSLSLGWLDLIPSNRLRFLESKSIGREHYLKNEFKEAQVTGVAAADSLLVKIREKNPLRAHIASNYLLEMRSSLRAIFRILKRDGYFVLVTGNNKVCGFDFDTTHYLSLICREIGFRERLVLVDSIKSRGLMTKRNKTASLISQEWVTVFQKV